MGLFGKSFEEKVQEAVEAVRGRTGVEDLRATVDGKVVTLHGAATSMERKSQVMDEFLSLIEPENTFNLIRVESPESEAAVAEEPVGGAESVAPVAESGPAAQTERIYEVAPGDTLGAIAQRFYGKASLYTRIFEANRDILDDPNLIKVGQKLRVPMLDD